jgi:small-conductance mechanosensitive channel
LLQFTLLVAALFYVSGLVRRWTVNRLLARTQLEPGVRLGIGAVLRYVLLIIGFLAIAQTMGINLTTFNVIAGAVGVGVGFGLQNIVSNFISGLIIMFERPVRVGDRVVLGALEGDVEEIGARRTTVRTDDNLTIIVPNSRFITENVINLSGGEARLRVSVSIQVPADVDADAVQALLLRIARQNPDVLAVPPPDARLAAIHPGGVLAFELQVWTSTRTHGRDVLQSALNYAIVSAFAASGIRLV